LKLNLLALSALFLAACQAAPEGGWGPVADATADAVRILPADGQPRRIALDDGRIIDQPVPAPDGSGLRLAGMAPCPGSRFGPVTLRRPASPRPDGTRLFVVMPFTFEADGAALLDCYARRFAAQGIASQRDGNIVNASLPEGHVTLFVDSAAGIGEIRLRRR